MPPRRAHVPWALALLCAVAACGRTPGTPARSAPTPAAHGTPIAGSLSAATIDPSSGGSVQSDDGTVTVSVPPGAFAPTPATSIAISIQQLTPNTAPGAIGNAYRIATVPAGAALISPVAITLDATGAVSTGTALEQISVAFQESSGWWVRFGSATHDPAANTVTVTTTHFSDWSLVTRSARDLRGTFTIDSTRWTHPIRLTGDTTLTYAGQDAVASYYLQSGTVTLTSPIVDGGVSCTLDPAEVATHAVGANVAELLSTEFRWGLSGDWTVTCNASSEYVQLVFDTMGVSDLACTDRGYFDAGHVAVAPTLTQDRVAGTYTVRCTSGSVTTYTSATWNYVSCTPGTACHPSGNACLAGSWSCDPTYPPGGGCAPTGNVADGTSCGAGQSCNAGSCVASRTVAGARRRTSWPEAGALPPAAAPDVLSPGTSIEAIVADGKGGAVTYPGTFAADGSFSIPSVPAGSYWLVFVTSAGVPQAFDPGAASSVDLGYDELGRPDVVAPAVSTPVVFDVTGLATGDVLEATSANADVHFSRAADVLPVTVDWLTAANGGPLDLLAAGDPLVVDALTALTAPTTVGTTAGSLPYRSASGWASISGTVIDPGLTTTVTATLTPGAVTGSLPVDWRTTQFEALLSGLGPQVASANATAVTPDPNAHALMVGASAFPLASRAPVAHGSPALLTASAPAGTADFVADAPLGYARFLSAALWNEWREVGYTAHVVYTATGATTSLDELASVVQREAMPAPTPIQPQLGPVSAPLVGGLSALAPQAAVGLTPTLSWTAPAVGVPSRYTLTVYKLVNRLGATVASPVVTFTTSATQVAVPPGFLQAGASYYARIEAALVPGDGGGAAPFRAAGTWARAAALTAVFTP